MLQGSDLAPVAQQDERLHQAAAQGRVQHCMVCVQQLYELAGEGLRLPRVALAHLWGRHALLAALAGRRSLLLAL